MSNVTISIHKVTGTSINGATVPVPSSTPTGTPERIVSAAGSAASTLAAPATEMPNYHWRIANMGTDNVCVTFGTAPTATTSHPGVPEKVAVING
jgi:hypothetical protein